MIVESKVQDFYKKLEENVTSDKLIWFSLQNDITEKNLVVFLIKKILKYTLIRFIKLID